jgi:hypothetical protein
MDAPSRRSLLRASVPLVAALAGCSAFDSSSESSPTDSSPSDSSPSDAPTPSPLPERSNLSHSGEVLSQATDTAPARVELRMTNESDRPVFPLPGPSGSLPAGAVRAEGDTGELVCFPPDAPHVHTVELAEVSTEGCWRFETPYGEKASLAYNPIEQSTELLSAGETVRSIHDVYYSGPDVACFPSGTYGSAVSLRFGTSENQLGDEIDGKPVEFRYQFDVTADGTVSVDAVDSASVAD